MRAGVKSALIVSVLLTTFAIVPSSSHAGDKYARYLAPESVCPNLKSENDVQEMLCYINYARTKRRLKKVKLNKHLVSVAAKKAKQITNCDDFSHTPCGTDFNRLFIRSKYKGHSWGENIAMMESDDPEINTTRELFDTWLYSKGHRENILRKRWKDAGLAWRVTRTKLGASDKSPAVLWVSNFGR